MHHLSSLFSPCDRTTRSHYWLIILALTMVLFGASSAKNEIGAAAAVTVVVAVQLVGLITTVRRLLDAGRSHWWLLLYLFPMTITWDLMHIQLGASTWSVVDVSAAIRLIPVILGLLAPSQHTAGGGIAQPRGIPQASSG